MKQDVGVGLRLELGGTDYGAWREATWGIDLGLNAVHSIEGDNVGLVLGATEHRPLVLERAWAGGMGTSDLLAAVTGKQQFGHATVEVVDGQAQRVATYELQSVVVCFLEHEISGDGVMLERLGLRYLNVSFSS